MNINLVSIFAGVLLLLVITYISLVYLFSPKYDPREPPVIPSLIPYVGHMLGLLRYGQRYFEILRSQVLHQPSKHRLTAPLALVTISQSTPFKPSTSAPTSSTLPTWSRLSNVMKRPLLSSLSSPHFLPESLTWRQTHEPWV